MKTTRRLSTRLVLETEAGLVIQWMWYCLDRRQDTSELEHSLRLRDALRFEESNMKELQEKRWIKNVLR
jgi:hypothetical protein